MDANVGHHGVCTNMHMPGRWTLRVMHVRNIYIYIIHPHLVTALVDAKHSINVNRNAVNECNRLKGPGFEHP